jgi:ornithine--oxo-acid transaminase
MLDVLRPGDHGSTFGGNPLASAVALEALAVLVDEHLPERAAELGVYFLEKLRALQSPLVTAVRGRGLLIGLEIDTRRVTARAVCLKLLEHGVVSRDTHGRVLRFAPPLVITRAEIDEVMALVERAFGEMEHG